MNRKNIGKRIIAFVLTIALVIGTFVFPMDKKSNVAKAAGSETIFLTTDYSNHIYKDTLNAKQVKFYERIEKEMNDSFSIYFDDYYDTWGISYDWIDAGELPEDEAREVFFDYLYDHPNYFWLQFKYNVITYDGITYAMKPIVDPELNTYKKIKAAWAEISPAVNKYVADLAALPDDFSRVRYVNENLAKDVTYEYDENGEPSDRKEAHSIVGPFRDKTSVCEGYSKAVYYLLNICQIPVILCTGYGINQDVYGNEEKEKHMWNCVQLDGKWYYMDTTWDSCVNDPTAWFLKGTENFTRHEISEDEKFLLSPAEGNFSEEDYDYSSYKSPAYVTLTFSCPSTVKPHYYNGKMELTPVDNKVMVAKDSEIRVEFDKTNYKISTEYGVDPFEGSFTAYKNATVRITAAKRNVTEISELRLIPGYGNTAPTGAYIDVFADGQWFYNIKVDSVSLFSTNKETVKNAIIQSGIPRSQAGSLSDYQVPYTSVYRNTKNFFNYGLDAFKFPSSLGIAYGSISYSNTSTLTINQNASDRVEIIVLDEQGNRIYGGSQVQNGTKLTLLAKAENEYVPAAFTCNYNLIEGNEIYMVSNLILSAKRVYDEAVDVKETAYEATVKNGATLGEIKIGLGASAYVNLKDGSVVRCPIVWNYDEFDADRKDAFDCEITGEIIFPDVISNPEDLDSTVVGTLHVEKAIKLTELVSEVPAELTVLAGTERDSAVLGLPYTLTFVDENGEKRSTLMDWKFVGEGNEYEVHGAVKIPGYDYGSDIVVKVKEQASDFSVLPAASIKYTINGEEITHANALRSESIVAALSVQAIKTHTNRVVKVTVPMGFTSVGVANASLIAGIKNSYAETVDGVTTITIEFDDDFYEDGVLTASIAMTSIYSQYNNALGMNYPAQSVIPITVSYEATENGEDKTQNLSMNKHLKISGGEEKFCTYGYFRNSFGADDIYKTDCTCTQAGVGKWHENCAYLVEYSIYQPLPNVITKMTPHNTQYMKWTYDNSKHAMVGTVNKSTTSFPMKFDYNSRTYFTFDGLTDFEYGHTYYGNEPVYIVGKDAFGNTYTYTTDTYTWFYIYPMDENPTIKPVYPVTYEYVTNPYPLYIGPISEFSYDANEPTMSLNVIENATVAYDIPDGIMVRSFAGMLSGYSDFKRINSIGDFESRFKEVRVEYYDTDETDVFYIDDLEYFVDPDDNYVHVAFPDKAIYEHRIKHFEIDYKLFQAGSYSAYLELLSYDTFSDGSEVVYGFEIHPYDPDLSGCPKYETPLTLKISYLNSVLEKEMSLYAFKEIVRYDTPAYGNSSKYAPSADVVDFKETSEVIDYIDDFREVEHDEEFEGIFVLDKSTDYIKFKKYELENNRGGDDAYWEVLYEDGSKDYFPADEAITIEETEENPVSGFRFFDESIERIHNNEERAYVTVFGSIDIAKWYEECGNVETTVKYLDIYATCKNNGEPGIDKSSLTIVPEKTETLYVGCYNWYFKNTTEELTLNYDDAQHGSITAYNTLVQDQGVNVTWNYVLNDRGVLFRSILHFSEIDLTLSLPTNQLVLDESVPVTLTDHLGVEHTATVTKANNAYKFVFTDVSLNFGETEVKTPIDFRLIPTFNAETKVSKITLTTTKAVLADEQPERDALPTFKYYDVKYNYVYTYAPFANVNVLTTFSDAAESYGHTEESTGLKEKVYVVEEDEEFQYVTHVYTDNNGTMNQFEAYITIPEKVENGARAASFDNEWTAEFKKLSLTAGFTNPKLYYQDEDGEYVEFNGADVPDGVIVKNIKVTADTVKNASEIVLSLTPKDSEDNGYIGILTNYSHYNETTSSVLNSKTNTVLYRLGPETSEPPVVDPDPDEPPVTPGDDDPDEPSVTPGDDDPDEPPVTPGDDDPDEPPVTPGDDDPDEPPVTPGEDAPNPEITPSPEVTPSPEIIATPDKATKEDAKPDEDIDKNSPETGDKESVGFLISLALVAMLAFAVSLRKKDK